MKLQQSGYGGCGLVIEVPLVRENKGCTCPREQMGGRSAPPAGVVSEAGRGVVGISDAGQPVHGVEGKRSPMRRAVDGINHAGAIESVSKA